MRLQDARDSYRQGRFADALQILDGGAVPTSEKLEADILRIEVLERLGNYPQSRFLADRALRARSLPLRFQSDCHATIGRIDLDEGRTDNALERFRVALDLATTAEDSARACWIQLRIMLVTCGMMHPEAASQLIASTRRAVLRLGDPMATAALHIYVGQVAVKHGAFRIARRHTRIGMRLLEIAPNLWLSAAAENNLVALAIIECDLDSGLRHALAGLQAAETSGAMVARSVCLGNLGNLYMLEGSWDKAKAYYREGVSGRQTDGERNNCIVESVARLHLLENRIADAQQCLDAIRASINSERDAALYPNRHAQLTQALVFMQEERYDEAFGQIEVAQKLAEKSGDKLLRNLCDLTRAEILCLQGRYGEFITLIDSLRPAVPTLPVELLAHYERVLGSAVAGSGQTSGIAHFGRAARVFDGLRHRPGQLQLQRASASLGVSLPIAQRLSPPDPALASHAARAVQDVLALLLHVGRPELLATDLVEVLAATGCIARVSASARHEDGRIEYLAAHAVSAAAGGEPLPSRTICVGTSRDRTIELTYEPMRNVDGIATVNAVTSLLDVVRDLDAARAEREERLGLWPVEELQDADDDAVIQGAMREVMRLVKKVAPTSASILITGESGTGKEIVARALHRYSNRTGRPFVPFNCTAVPRDLLESHLFGYRRGAFTGAERDHPGVVRIAKDGTLFLDEVGELSLDLQPKLLRFLESGEINPLGEAEPVRVTARIVAATNANLERLVQEGRFRPDLFYRLRVVPLSIPPLRERRDEIPFLARHFVQKAAREYDKGEIQLDDEVLELLGLYHWPGNVRELNNELRRIVALSDNDKCITADALSPEIRRGRVAGSTERDGSDGRGARHETLNAALARLEREMIAAALKTHSGRLDDTAKALGISRKGLYLKRLRFGL